MMFHVVPCYIALALTWLQINFVSKCSYVVSKSRNLIPSSRLSLGSTKVYRKI